jgi:DNA modification methylase
MVMADTETGEPEARKVSPKNKLNDLTARQWLPETVSVWRQKGLGAKHPDAQIERQHPAPFSFTDVARLVRFFSKEGETVLDPFVGVGSTLKAAATEGRRGVGIELSETFADLTRQRLETEVAGTLFEGPQQIVHQGDARSVLPALRI